MTTAVLAIRMLLAAVFAVAGIAKLRDLDGSRGAMRDFGVPANLAGPAGVLLPVAELAGRDRPGAHGHRTLGGDWRIPAANRLHFGDCERPPPRSFAGLPLLRAAPFGSRRTGHTRSQRRPGRACALRRRRGAGRRARRLGGRSHRRRARSGRDRHSRCLLRRRLVLHVARAPRPQAPAWACTAACNIRCTRRSDRGSSAPDFTLPDLQGKTDLPRFAAPARESGPHGLREPWMRVVCRAAAEAGALAAFAVGPAHAGSRQHRTGQGATSPSSRSTASPTTSCCRSSWR